MPKIIGQQEQQRALKEITAALREVTAINRFLSRQNTSGIYAVSFTDDQNEKQSCFLFSTDRDDVDLLVLNYKDRLKSKIQSLTETYRIALEPQEQAMLDNNDLSSSTPAPLTQEPDNS